LQEESGDTEVVYDGKSLTVFDAASNTIYTYTPAAGEGSQAGTEATAPPQGAPSLEKIEEAIAHIQRHAGLSGATPTDVAGQPAYTVRISPDEGGSLLAGAELSFDAVHGFPLRAAVYSTTTPEPVVELAASEISYGPVEASVFEISPPAGAKVERLSATQPHHGARATSAHRGNTTKLTGHGHGIASIGVLETTAKPGSASTGVEGLPKVDIDGTSAGELRTELGTILTFVRADRRYVLAGSVTPAAIEAVARGL
jgi:outer membrane lipoprotein-sorting protein